MAQAKTGDTVRVHYHGTLDDGSVFDSSLEREPMEFVIGEGQLLPGFESAVLGMEVEESKTIRIPAAEAYGEYHDEFVVEAPREIFPEDLALEVGLMLQIPHRGRRHGRGPGGRHHRGHGDPGRQPPPGGQGPDFRADPRGHRLGRKRPRTGRVFRTRSRTRKNKNVAIYLFLIPLSC